MVEPCDISLRQWLDKPSRVVDLLECLHIFRQIVEIVNIVHSQGIVVHNIRPSCFMLSTFNRISFAESASSFGLDLNEEPLKLVGPEPMVGELISSSPISCGFPQASSLCVFNDSKLGRSLTDTPAKGSERSEHGGFCGSMTEAVNYSRPTSGHYTYLTSTEATRAMDVSGRNEHSDHERLGEMSLKQAFVVEKRWYTSPEEADGAVSTFASDIYRLGVLLFELYYTCSSEEEKLITMSNLRHRVLPPQLLMRWPKEASFCLWLLHPKPNMRPKMSEVLQSKFLDELIHERDEQEVALKIKEEMNEQEQLLEFLLEMLQRKQAAADRLQEIVCMLSSDVEEVLSQQSNFKKDITSNVELDMNKTLGFEMREAMRFPHDIDDPFGTWGHKKFKSSETDEVRMDLCGRHLKNMSSKNSRVMRHFKKLEAAYFSTRYKQMKSATETHNCGSPSRGFGDIRNMRAGRSHFSSIHNLPVQDSIMVRSGWVGPFLEDLSKYLSFSSFKVRSELKQGDLLNSSNLVCSVSFDRDQEFLATAGVNRKIKVFERNVVFNGNLDIHYPVIEMTSRSKLSSICWNSYIKHQIASSDFEGVVQVWDAMRGQALMDLREHERRVWSVDFSQADPTRLASGSDDGSVKLWNINQGGSIGTIKTKANVCSVQFPPDPAHTLAIGSADHKVYIYDLRNTRIPSCTLTSHTKTVSYIKFIDSTTLVSASTDNTLKLWDLSLNSSAVINSPTLTFTGHTNLKNFVGLSVSDGYIATGSETNEVFVYYKAFPMPVLSYKFSSAEGSEEEDDSQFVSCVCWSGESSTLVAANSAGNIKILDMVSSP